MAHEFRALDEAELLEFFGVNPVERVVDDGYWCYEIASRISRRVFPGKFGFETYTRPAERFRSKS